MEGILHHLRCIKPFKKWDKLPTSTGESRISGTHQQYHMFLHHKPLTLQPTHCWFFVAASGVKGKGVNFPFSTSFSAFETLSSEEPIRNHHSYLQKVHSSWRKTPLQSFGTPKLPKQRRETKVRENLPQHHSTRIIPLQAFHLDKK